jgi:hypothetical protein
MHHAIEALREASQADRRRTTRLPVNLSVALHDERGARTHRLVDLSLDGAFLEAATCEAGSVVDISLPLADGLPALRTRGVVVRGDHRGAAVRFEKLRTKDMVRIAETLFG